MRIALILILFPTLITVARYNNDGSLDTSFGSSGTATADFLGTGSVLRAVSFQSDGSIVAVGSVSKGSKGTTLRLRGTAVMAVLIQDSAGPAKLLLNCPATKMTTLTPLLSNQTLGRIKRSGGINTVRSTRKKNPS
jgi:hypothetical protein